MEKLRVAIIGAGQIARISHIPNYQSFKNEVEIVGICDRNPDSARAVAEQFGIKNHFSDYHEMIDRLKPDLVSVCVPNKFHCEVTCDALNGGCHVMCEKPPAMNSEEAVRMEKTAENNSKLLSYGFHLRHSKNVAFLKSKIENGDFGEIYSAKTEWLRRRGIPGWGSFTNKDIQGGGPLIDIGAHMLDLVFYLLDYPEVDYVCATAHDKIGKRKGVGLMGDWDPSQYMVEDCLFGFIKFKNGVGLSFGTSFALNMKEKNVRNLQIFGDKLGATLFPLETFGEESFMLKDTSYPSSEEEDLHLKSLTNFIHACRNEEELLVTAKQGVYVQKILSALYESASSGHPKLL